MSAAAQTALPKAATTARTRTTTKVAPNRRTFLRPTRTYKERTNEPADNYAPVPHMFWRLAGIEKISGAVQMSVLGYVMARTWGDPDKPAWALITLSDLARELKCSTKMIELAVADAIERGLIAVKKAGQQRSYQLTPQNWEAAPKYVPKYVPKNVAADDEGEDSEAPDEEPADAGAKAYTGETLVVMPGKRSKVLPLRFAIKGHADPVELKLDFRNEIADLPLSFSATAAENGRFSVTARLAERLTKGEEKAENLRNALRRFSDPPSMEDAATTRVEEYRKFLSHLLLDRFAKPLDERFFAEIVANAGETPITVFSEVVEQRMRRGKHHTTGLLRELAKDAQKLHAARQARDTRPASPPAGSNDAAVDPHAALREFAAKDPDDYEYMRRQRIAIGETDWPTLAELGVRA